MLLTELNYMKKCTLFSQKLNTMIKKMYIKMVTFVVVIVFKTV
jgi:hypothetical protein